MWIRPLFCFLALSLALAPVFPQINPAEGRNGCPVTSAPDPPFAPPLPYRPHTANGQFLYGTPALWALVNTHWRVHDGSKLPYFRQGFDSQKEPDPRLTVVARRIDSASPMVWAGWASSASIDDTVERMFMVTGLRIPTSGCWEISAHYTPDRGNIRTLTYTVWVEP